MSGLTSTGFTVRRLQTILDAIDAELLANVSDQLNLDGEESVIGQIRGVLAQEISLVWESLGDLYRALDPSSAVGEQLDIIGRFSGLTRLGAARGIGTITAAGTPGTIIPAGSRASNSTTQVIVETSSDATIGGGGTVLIPVRSVEAGLVVSGVDGIDTIVTPVSGWASISASSALTGSRDQESDTDYRARLASIRAIVASVEGAIRAKILEVDGVESCIVLSNRTSTTDSNATPPHSARIVIEPDLEGQTEIEEAIATAIFETLPAGIDSYGIGLQAQEATVVDAQGYDQVVRWEYAQFVPINVDLDIDVLAEDTTLSASEIETAIEEAFTAYIDALGLGVDVRPAALQGIAEDVVPIWAVNSLLLDITPSPAGTASITILFNEYASTNEINVTVTLV